MIHTVKGFGIVNKAEIDVFSGTLYFLNKLWKILKEMGIPDHLTCLLRNLCAGQEETETAMEKWTGSKLGKEYVKAVYCHPAYLTSMQSTL